MGGIKGYRPSKQNSKLHQNRLQPKKVKATGKGEAEVVPGFQLAAVVQDWVVKYLIDHPPTTFHVSSVTHFGAMNWLAQETGISVRRLNGIKRGEYVTVPISQADAILTAIDRNYMLGHEIQVVPNATWSTKRLIEHLSKR
jgi:hypothetical protein